MRRKSIAFIIFVCLLTSIFSSQLTAFAAGSGPIISLQLNNGNNLTTSNTIYANFRVTNESASAINLANIKLRYYYTIETEKAQNFWCDYSEIIYASNHQNITGKVTGTFVKMNTAVPNADYYLEVGFSSDAGTIPVGGSIEVQTRIAKSDWSNYEQSNDYSYASSASYINWGKVTAYVNNNLVLGVVTDYFAPTITPSSVSFDMGNPVDIKVNIKSEGYTLRGIVGLIPGIDYIVSGNTVTISKGYLLTLAADSYKQLTFDFGVPNNPSLNVYIYHTWHFMGAKIGTTKGNKGDTVTLPITFEGLKGRTNIGVCMFDINFDNTLLEPTSVSPGAIIINPDVNFSYEIKTGKIIFFYLDYTIGSELIAKDGVFADIKFKILGDQGKTVPVTFGKQATFGDGDFSQISYFILRNGSVTINKVVIVAQ